MNVGLPGTGIGGLFYLTLAALMPAHAAWQTLRGRASAWGWRTAALHSAIAGLILLALWVESWVLRGALTCAVAREWLHGGVARDAYVRVVSAQSSTVAMASAGTLAAVLIGVHGAGGYLSLRRPRSRAPAAGIQPAEACGPAREPHPPLGLSPALNSGTLPIDAPAPERESC